MGIFILQPRLFMPYSRDVYNQGLLCTLVRVKECLSHKFDLSEQEVTRLHSVL